MRSLVFFSVSLAMVLMGCGQGDRADAASGAGSVASAQTLQADDNLQKQQELERHLAELDDFNQRLWPEKSRDAGVDWLKASAAGSGLKLTHVTPKALHQAAGVTIRPVIVQAHGLWPDVVEWLAAIENSKRRLVLRGVELHANDGRVTADLKIAVLINRAASLEKLSSQDLAALRGEPLDLAVQRLGDELRHKRQTLTRLSAGVSWSRPIVGLTDTLPGSAKPVSLTLKPAGSDARVQQLTGTFTLLVTDAGHVPTYVRRLQRQAGFIQVGLRSLRHAEAGLQRAAVTFTFDGKPFDNTSSPTD